MIGLEITAITKEPIVYYDDGLHIDGPLAFAAYMDLSIEERNKVPPITRSWAIDFDLPLAVWSISPPNDSFIDRNLLDKNGNIWGWKASAVYANWQCESFYALRRKPDISAMSRYSLSPSLNIGAGYQKAIDLKFPEKWADTLKWFVVGNLERTEYLLNTYIRAIGKLHNKGPGRINKWQIKKSSKADELWKNRIMPSSFKHKNHIFVGRRSIRPPYHHNSRRCEAVAPIFDKLIIE